jgi:ubiquinone/menaquinone biosynthesis C-methylase UbiE
VSGTYEAKRHYQQEEIASTYDAVRFRGLRGAFVNRLEQRLLMQTIAGLPPGALVLDLPTGTGRMARRLAQAGYRVVGADISLPMLSEARRNSAGTNAGLVHSEAESLPFAGKSIDAVVCFRLMSHLPAEARVAILNEMARVARERVVVVYQPHRAALWWLVYGLLLRKPLPRFYASLADLAREFATSGLEPVRSHSLLRGVFMERAYVLAPA